VSLSTWKDLGDYFCGNQGVLRGKSRSEDNPYYEDLARRRYNYAVGEDSDSLRLVFLKDVLKDKTNKTLRRDGRFIWCKNIKYEGVCPSSGYRTISFCVDQGQKRFFVAENNILCLPSRSYVNNNRFFRQNEKIFYPFGTVFGYSQSIEIMAEFEDCSAGELRGIIDQDSPFKPGTLVAPRLGYFYPAQYKQTKDPFRGHPYGIILGTSFPSGDYAGREFYRVSFADTIYERVHPVQMEIINEV
jgi:hypothetical protein